MDVAVSITEASIEAQKLINSVELQRLTNNLRESRVTIADIKESILDFADIFYDHFDTSKEYADGSIIAIIVVVSVLTAIYLGILVVLILQFKA